jgi:hypothetical protein
MIVIDIIAVIMAFVVVVGLYYLIIPKGGSDQ